MSITTFLINFAYTAQSFAQEYCNQNVCVITEKKSDRIIFHLKNANFYPLSIKIYFEELKNMSADTKLPYLSQLKANSTVEAFSIYRLNHSLAYNYKFKYIYCKGSALDTHIQVEKYNQDCKFETVKIKFGISENKLKIKKNKKIISFTDRFEKAELSLEEGKYYRAD